MEADRPLRPVLAGDGAREREAEADRARGAVVHEAEVDAILGEGPEADGLDGLSVEADVAGGHGGDGAAGRAELTVSSARAAGGATIAPHSATSAATTKTTGASFVLITAPPAMSSRCRLSEVHHTPGSSLLEGPRRGGAPAPPPGAPGAGLLGAPADLFDPVRDHAPDEVGGQRLPVRELHGAPATLVRLELVGEGVRAAAGREEAQVVLERGEVAEVLCRSGRKSGWRS